MSTHNHQSYPVLLIIFNREDTSLRVVEQIRKSGANKVYLFCDGARNDIAGENDKIKNIRLRIMSILQEFAEVKTFFLEENKGPRVAVGEGISWFFQNEEAGIILEHDCLPDQDFFRFCANLLERYKEDERVMHIGGNNFQFGKKYGKESYYFSRFNHIWGWATWRRAWKYYDNTFKDFPEFRDKGLIKHIFKNKSEHNFWIDYFQKIYDGKIVTWDAQWTMAMWIQNGLAVIPQTNLVSNIGFGKEAVNTGNKDDILSEIPTHSIGDLIHPKIYIPNLDADYYSFRKIFKRPFLNRILSK